MAARRTSIVGEATFDGVIACALLPRNQVRRLLPSGLELALPAAGSMEGHPVTLAMGRQRDTAVCYGGMPLSVAIDYDEWMLSVPFVHATGGRRLHTFVAAMLSGDRRATWSGNVHYGFGKRPGSVERFGDVWTAASETGGLTMYAAMSSAGEWQDGATGAAQRIQRCFDAPVLGRRADGRYIASYFDWRLEDATTRSIALTLGFSPPFDLPAEMILPAGAAVEVRGMRWRLSWPEAPRF